MELEHWKLDELERLVNEKFPWEKRHRMAMLTMGRIVGVVSKNFIKTHGYSVATTVMKREIRKLGREDAKMITDAIGIDKVSEENIKSILNIAGIILGLKLELTNGREVVVKDCPFFESVKELNEPFICNLCTEYNNGILEGLVRELGRRKFVLNPAKKLSRGDEYCVYKVLKRG